mmetsp:Transcript_30036/g.76493  ORF Transcript_30036/g.76493 Transcript_30036/m.76493 type:complete len:294 (-) Transcript_30036:78-959(-)
MGVSPIGKPAAQGPDTAFLRVVVILAFLPDCVTPWTNVYAFVHTANVVTIVVTWLPPHRAFQPAFLTLHAILTLLLLFCLIHQPTPPLIIRREPEDRALVASDVAARLLALHGIRNVEVPVQVDPLDPKGAAGDLRVVEVRSHRGREEAGADCHLHDPLVVAILDRLDGLPHHWARYGGHLNTPTRLQPAAGLGRILLEDVRDRVRGLLVVRADGAAVRVLERAVNDLDIFGEDDSDHEASVAHPREAEQRGEHEHALLVPRERGAQLGHRPRRTIGRFLTRVRAVVVHVDAR